MKSLVQAVLQKRDASAYRRARYTPRDGRPKGLTCKACGAALVQPKEGRTRSYCNQRCRYVHKRSEALARRPDLFGEALARLIQAVAS